MYRRTQTKHIKNNVLSAELHLWTLNSRDGVVPEDTDGFGSLLRLQQGVLQGDGGVQDGRKRRTLTVHRGAHDSCVDHWTVWDPGKTFKQKN